MLLATCVNTPIYCSVFHNLRACVARCSASCVNGALLSVGFPTGANSSMNSLQKSAGRFATQWAHPGNILPNWARIIGGGLVNQTAKQIRSVIGCHTMNSAWHQNGLCQTGQQVELDGQTDDTHSRRNTMASPCPQNAQAKLSRSNSGREGRVVKKNKTAK